MTPDIICKNCGNQFIGKFCNQCGEKLYTDEDKKLKHFFEEAFHFITHFDSKFFKTVKLVFFKPGFVSQEVSNGVRKKYFKPVSLFLIGVIIYLLFPLAQGMNIYFNGHLGQYEALGIHFPGNWVEAKMASRNISQAQLAELFDKKSEKVSKILLFIIIPLTGLWLRLLFSRKDKYYFDHFTLAAEINTFNLYFNFMLTPLAVAFVTKLVSWTGGSHVKFGEELGFILFVALVIVTYVTAALKRFYAIKTWQAFLKSFLFLAGFFVIIFLIYRLILFCIVMLLI